MKFINSLLLLLLVAITPGCLPSTTVTVDCGHYRSMREFNQAEEILKQVGFSRRWFKSSTEQSLPRFEYGDELMSGFEDSRLGMGAMGAGVSFRKSDGWLRVTVGERNTKFSPEGKLVVEQVLQKMRQAFGEQSLTIHRPP